MSGFPRSPYGGQSGMGSRSAGSRGGFSLFPPGIKFLLVANVGVFLAEMLFGKFHFGNTPPVQAYIDYLLYLWPIGSPHFYPWQLVSYMFFHDGFSHIAFNMFALWMFGVEVENIWGTKKFLTYYLVCGLGGAVSHLLMSSILGLEGGPLLGASGAIFGVLVAFGLMFPNRPIYFFPLFFIGIPAKFFVAGYMAIEVWATWAGSDNISHLAHLGGAVTGMIYMLVTTGGHLLRIRKQDGSAGGSFWQRPGPTPPRQPGFFNRPPRAPGAVDAEYHDIESGTTAAQQQADVKKGRVITQDEVDRILDKIAATGYQNLTEQERDILFEASRRMEERR